MCTHIKHKYIEYTICVLCVCVTSMYICGDLLWEIGSWDFGAKEVPRSALCKLEIQKSQWYNSVWVQRPGTQGSWWCKSQSEGRRRWDETPSSSSKPGKKGQIPPFSAFCSIYTLNGLDGAHPHREGQDTGLRAPIEMLIWSRNATTDTSRSSMWSGHPVAT